MKKKEKIVDVLAAGLVKLLSKGGLSDLELQKIQLSNVPGLLADSEEVSYRRNYKTDMRKPWKIIIVQLSQNM